MGQFPDDPEQVHLCLEDAVTWLDAAVVALNSATAYARKSRADRIAKVEETAFTLLNDICDQFHVEPRQKGPADGYSLEETQKGNYSRYQIRNDTVEGTIIDATTTEEQRGN